MEYMMPYLDAATNRSIYPKIQKAISADPDLRYESPQALYSALKEVIETTGRRISGRQLQSLEVTAAVVQHT